MPPRQPISAATIHEIRSHLVTAGRAVEDLERALAEVPANAPVAAEHTHDE